MTCALIWHRSEKQMAPLQELLKLQSTGVDISNAMPFGLFVQQWYDVYKRPYLREKSQSITKYVINQYILPSLGNCIPREITPMQIQAVMAYMADKSNSLQSKVLIALRDIFRAAVENGLVAKSPVSDRLKAGGKPTEEKVTLTPDEEAALLDTVKIPVPRPSCCSVSAPAPAAAIDKAMRTKLRASAPYRSARDQRQRELTRAVSALEGYADLTARKRTKLDVSAFDAASYAAMRDLVPGYAEAAREGQVEASWLTTMDSLTEDSGLRREELLLLRAGTSGVEGIKNAAGKTVAGSAGLRKMERAYSLLPGLSRLSEAQRRQVFGWLNVGSTVAGLSPADVSGVLRAIE